MFTRLSSDLFPWGDSGKYKLEELPDLPEIAVALAEVGTLARLYQQRLTSHPSAFVKLAAQKEDIVYKSIWDLELHSKVSRVLQTASQPLEWLGQVFWFFAALCHPAECVIAVLGSSFNEIWVASRCRSGLL